MQEEWQGKVREAIALIARTPGYADLARELSVLLSRGRIRFVPTLPDRGQAMLNGTILLGPEPLSESALSLAETLVHEAFHRRQFPLQKTASFWSGVFTGTPIMRRYERPAYEAALQFLKTVEQAFPEMATIARSEQTAVAATFAANYGEPLV